jgi:CheY-like chemotaxis protein
MKKVILLAEDSPDDALVFTHVLRSAGILNPVTEVRNGAETIAYIRGEGAFGDRELHPLPTVLFLDLLMPGGDGWDVLKWLRTHPTKSTMLVVVLTGVAQRQMLREAYLAGANSFLVKPFSKSELDSLVSAWPHLWMLAPSDPRAPAHPQNGQNLEPRV